MSNPAIAQWPRTIPRLDSAVPYLRILFVTIYVRDVDRSIRFYVDQLGFNLIFDSPVGGGRFVAVGPPDGSAVFALAPVQPDSEAFRSIGRPAPVVFLTENVVATYEEWCKRGVQFQEPPHKPVWGGLFASLEDPDGNSLKLVESDDLSRELDSQRRALADKLEQERRTAQELEIAKQVQARLFPQKLPMLNTLEYAGMCIQAREVGGDYYDFLNLGQERIGLVMADTSGKGIGAALLMANLQANLRSQSAIALDQPEPRNLRLEYSSGSRINHECRTRHRDRLDPPDRQLRFLATRPEQHQSACGRHRGRIAHRPKLGQCNPSGSAHIKRRPQRHRPHSFVAGERLRLCSGIDSRL